MEKARGFKDNISLKVAAVSMGLMTAPTIVSFAAESSPGTSYLSGEVLDAINVAFSNLSVTITQVVGIAVIAGCSIIGITSASKYAMKKIKGTLNQAG